jgi:hypothetical protein
MGLNESSDAAIAAPGFTFVSLVRNDFTFFIIASAPL